MLTLRKLGASIFAIMMLLSCSDTGQVNMTSAALTIIPPSKMRISQICQSYLQEDFESIVNLMHNYKDQPHQFQKQLVNMMKQSAAEREKSDLKITQIATNQIVVHKNDKAANVYLDVSYNNGQEEEIILPMIYDKGNWWIK